METINTNLITENDNIIIQIKKFNNCHFINISSDKLKLNSLSYSINSEFDEQPLLINILNEEQNENEEKDFIELNLKALTNKLKFPIFFSSNLNNINKKEVKLIFDKIKGLIN